MKLSWCRFKLLSQSGFCTVSCLGGARADVRPQTLSYRSYSALVGLVAMLVLFPIPGYITTRTQRLQKEKMLKVTSHRAEAKAYTDVLADGCSSASSDGRYVVVLFLQSDTLIVPRMQR